MIAEKARDGAQGIDCDTRLDAAACARLKAAGIDFVVRYLRDVPRTELDVILGADLAFMGAGHVRYPGWTPSSGMGLLDGINLANAGRALTLPAGVTLWCDVEGVSPAATASDVIAYVNAWCESITAGGFEPGLYVGYASLLTGRQLYHSISTRRYWKSGSQVPTPAERGYSMIQTTLDAEFVELRVDRDVIKADGFGDVPTWARRV
jgi:hypothetical protein